MNRNKKYDERYVTSIPFEKKYFDLAQKLLPKGVDLSDEINVFVKDLALRLEREEKKVDPLPQRDPTSSLYTQANNISVQTTLDIFGDRRSISEYLGSLDDLEKLRDLRAKGHLIESVCKHQIRKKMAKFN